MSMRILAAIPALLFLSVSGAALAQEAVATARNAPSGGAPAAAPAPIQTVDEQQDVQDGPLPRMGFCGPIGVDANGKPDKRIHGQAGAAVGTHGYQAYHVAACKPFGKDGTSGVAISVTDARIGRR